MPLRIGLDLVAVETVAESLRSGHREHYLERIYTAAEIADCRDSNGEIKAASLAARFAAKEATVKALPGTGEELPLRSIEVVREPNGKVRLALSGKAAELAREARAEEIALSLSHEVGMAAAVVVIT